MKRKKLHPYTVMLSIIVIITILTWLIPAGKYERVFDIKLNKEILLPDSFKYIDKTPVSLLNMFPTIFKGFIESADISFFLIFAFGYINILIKSNSIEVLALLLLKKLKNKENLIIVFFIVFFAICGSTLGMYEEVLGFVPLFISIFLSLGYDKFIGGSIVILGSGVGFAASTINPFSIGLASNIAGIPIITPPVLIFRIFSLIIFLIITIFYIINYAKNIKNKPELSLLFNEKQNISSKTNIYNNTIITSINKITIALFIAVIIIIALGTMLFNFYINEIAAIFFIFMIITGLLNKWNLTKIFNEFILSSKDMMFTVLMIGFGRTIQVIITDGNIIDSIIFQLSSLIGDLPKQIAAIIMLFVQNILCFFIPSGSGQAVISIPILAPIADIIGLSKNIVILTYQFGNGFAYLFWPIGVATICAIMQIGLDKWYKFFTKLYIYFLIMQIILIISAVYLGI